jgi:hypothetical protein
MDFERKINRKEADEVIHLDTDACISRIGRIHDILSIHLKTEP